MLLTPYTPPNDPPATLQQVLTKVCELYSLDEEEVYERVQKAGLVLPSRPSASQ